VEALVRKLILILSLSLPLLAVSAFAEEWSKSYTVGAKPSLRVDTNDATIEISRGAGSTIAARVTTNGYPIGSAGVRVTEHQDGDKVELNVHIPNQVGFHISLHNSWNNRQVRVEVQVPAETALDVHSSDGHINVDGTTGGARIDTSDGAIEVHNFSGAVRARTSDGHITVDGVVNEVYLHSGDGQIDFTARQGSRMERAWEIHTSDGRVSVKLPDDFAAELYAHTGDGHITTDFPITVSGALDRGRMRGKLNGGGELLEISTGDGSIHVGKL
jgi:riboflavin synthase alpha subunit